MTKIKLPVQHRTLIFALILVLSGFSSSLTQVSAQSIKLANNSSNSSKGIVFKRIKAPNRGLPRGTRQAAKRGEGCPEVKIPLTALVPISETESGEKVDWGLTSAEHPNLWFYVPYSLTDKRPGELRIKTKDENGNNIYKTLIKVTGTNPGIISISWHSTEAPLKIGESYIYQLVVGCNPDEASENEFVTASIERQEPSATLKSQLSKATPRQRAILYAQEGFWDESLTTLGELRRANPNDASLTADWGNLLESAGLSEIKQEPIVP